MLIVIIIVAALVIFYINTVSSLTLCLVVLGVLAGLLVLNCVTCFIVKKRKYRVPEGVKAQLKEAEEKDRIAAAHNKKVRQQREREHAAEVKKTIAAYREELADARAEQNSHKCVLAEMDVVGPEEQNVEALDQLIAIMKGHRANSITEALWRYDEEVRQKKEDSHRRVQELRQRLLQEQQYNEMQRKIDEQNAQIARHNATIEKEFKRAADELEELRKDEDYYRRYGQPRP